MILSSYCSPDCLILIYQFCPSSAGETYSSHSSSVMSILSKNSYEEFELAEPPSQVYSRKAGLAVKFGVSGSCGLGGNRNFNLKSIEFSEAGFHFNLTDKLLSD